MFQYFVPFACDRCAEVSAGTPRAAKRYCRRERVPKQETIKMKNIKSLAIAAALLAGASSLAMAQSNMSQPSGNTQQNAASSGGAGTHTTGVKTGTASNNEKVLHNQNGYKNGQQ
jgi:hypothetical protein